MQKVLIATSGYSYPDWKEVFYPPEIKAQDYLAYYARKFPFTELNFSYYRQPDPRQSEGFLTRTPQEFLFTVKAHRSLTHLRPPEWKQEAATFIDGIRPLTESGRLGAVILQFPYSFGYTRENRLYLARLCEALAGLPLAVEFRKKEWQLPSVWKGLEDRRAAVIITDNPPLPGLPAPEPVVTADWGYIRFHGRNEESWWGGNNITRYDYRYSEEELTDWARTIDDLSRQVKRLFVAFNNHRKGQAVENALLLKTMLEENPQDPPPGEQDD